MDLDRVRLLVAEELGVERPADPGSDDRDIEQLLQLSSEGDESAARGLYAILENSQSEPGTHLRLLKADAKSLAALRSRSTLKFGDMVRRVASLAAATLSSDSAYSTAYFLESVFPLTVGDQRNVVLAQLVETWSKFPSWYVLDRLRAAINSARDDASLALVVEQVWRSHIELVSRIPLNFYDPLEPELRNLMLKIVGSQ